MAARRPEPPMKLLSTLCACLLLSTAATAAKIRPDTRKHLNLRAQLSKNLLHPKGRPHTDVGSTPHSGPSAPG